MNIKVTCKGQKYVKIDSLKNFQGDLKKLEQPELEKLKRSIIKHGFSFPVFVWDDNILDGHQRIYATKELIKDGYQIGDIPIVEIDAQDRTEAAEKLLFLNSQYAKITDDGLFEFLNDNKLNLEDLKTDLSLTDIDVEYFLNQTDEIEPEKISDDLEKKKPDDEIIKIKITCTSKNWSEYRTLIKEKINEICKQFNMDANYDE